MKHNYNKPRFNSYVGQFLPALILGLLVGLVGRPTCDTEVISPESTTPSKTTTPTTTQPQPSVSCASNFN